MEAVLVIGLAVLILFVADRLGLLIANNTVVVLVLVRGFAAWLGGKLDPWPYGVQEEDRDRPWASGSPSPPTLPTLPPLPPPNLSRVRPVVHAR